MTKQLYLTDTYRFELNSSITAKKQDDKGLYLLLDQTIFYPQGGGQPSDQGSIKGESFEFNVTSVRQIENEIRHYIINDNFTISNDNNVICLINKDRRLLNSQYHTAAHLLGNVVETIYPSLKAIKGHSFPNEAYVEFQGSEIPDIEKLHNELNKIIAKEYNTKIFEIDPVSFEEKFYKLPYLIPNNKVFRVMQIENFLPVPCGGTHLASISEIGNMSLGRIKVKNGIINITYKLN